MGIYTLGPEKITKHTIYYFKIVRTRLSIRNVHPGFNKKNTLPLIFLPQEIKNTSLFPCK